MQQGKRQEKPSGNGQLASLYTPVIGNERSPPFIAKMLNINTMFAMLASVTLDSRDAAAPPEMIW